MTVKHERKLLWICTLILAASATVFLIAFTFTPTLVGAADTQKNCEKPDPTTGIRICKEIVLRNHPSPVIQETCVKACADVDVLGIPARITTEGGENLYCIDAQGTFSCEGVTVEIPTFDERIITQEEEATIAKEATEAKKDCGGLFDVGCWISKLFDKIVGIPFALVMILPAGILYFVVAILGTLFSVTAFVMKVFIENTMAIPVTPDPGTFVGDGWNLTRNLVNIVFLLILAFIGLATSLRLQTYQAQKTLPMLILIALLVNFSGLLVGFFVDMGNILTNAFLRDVGSFGSLASQLESIGEQFLAFFKQIGQAFLGEGSMIAETLKLLTQLIVAGLYFALGYLILLIIMIVFFVRVIALWVLTILAPLAFAAYILPATRQMWSMWFKNLIQWSFIGVPISFFLLLSSKLLEIMGNPEKAPVFLETGSFPTDAQSSVIADSIAGLFGNFAVLAIMAVGIFISMQFVPQGAQGVVNFTKTLGGRAALATGSAAMRKFGTKGMQQFAENLRKRGQGQEVKKEDQTRLERMPGMGVLLGAISSNPEKALNQRRKNLRRIDELLEKGDATEEEKNELTQLQQTTEGPDAPTMEQLQENVTKQRLGMRTTIARWSARTVGGGLEIGAKELTMRVGDKDIREVQQGMKEVGDKDSFMVFNMVKEELLKKGFANKNRILGLLNGVRERGDSDDIRDALDQGILDKKLIGETIKTGMRVGPPGFRPLLKSFYGHIFSDPQAYGFDVRLDEQGKVIAGIGKDAKFLGEQQKSLPSKFKPQDLQGDTSDPNHWKLDSKDPNIRKAAETFVNMILEYRDADFMGQMARRERKGERDTIMQYIGKEGPFAESGLGEEWLLEKAPAVLRYMTSTTSRSAGVGFDMTPGEADVKIEITHSLNRIQDQAVREETKSIVKSIVRDIQGIRNENLLAVANNLVQFESLRAPLVRLVAIQKTRQEIGRELRRGAPQATISSLEQKIAQEVQAVKAQVAQAAGTSQNPTQLEDAWDRIEQGIQGRGQQRRGG